MLCKLSFCFTNPSQENNMTIYYSQIRIRHFKLMHLNIIITNPERGKSSDSRLISLILGLVKLHRIFAFFSDSYNLFGFLVRSLSWTQQMFSTGLLSSMECPKNPQESNQIPFGFRWTQPDYVASDPFWTFRGLKKFVESYKIILVRRNMHRSDVHLIMLLRAWSCEEESSWCARKNYSGQSKV